MQHEKWEIKLKIGQKPFSVKNQLQRWILHPRIVTEAKSQETCPTSNFGQKYHAFLMQIVIFHQKCPFWGLFGSTSLIIHDCDHLVCRRPLIIHEFINYYLKFHQSFINFWAQESVWTPLVSILVFACSIWWNWQILLIWLWLHH